MPANTDPIYSRIADVQMSTSLHSTPGTIGGPTAVTAQDGTGALQQIFVSDSVNGSYCDSIVMKPIGAPVASVARIFLCSATGAFTPGTTNTAINTTLLTELTLGAQALSQTQAATEYTIPIRRQLPPGWSLLIAYGTSTGATGTGYVATTFGGKY
jgi:hypothetical protein